LNHADETNDGTARIEIRAERATGDALRDQRSYLGCMRARVPLDLCSERLISLEHRAMQHADRSGFRERDPNPLADKPSQPLPDRAVALPRPGKQRADTCSRVIENRPEKTLFVSEVIIDELTIDVGRVGNLPNGCCARPARKEKRHSRSQNLLLRRRGVSLRHGFAIWAEPPARAAHELPANTTVAQRAAPKFKT